MGGSVHEPRGVCRESSPPQSGWRLVNRGGRAVRASTSGLAWAVGIAVGLMAGLIADCHAIGDESGNESPAIDPALIRLPRVLLPQEDAAPEFRLALGHCQRCHGFPDPGSLPRSTWENDVLPKMGALLGMHHGGYPEYAEKMRFGATPDEEALVRSANIVPPTPLMTRADWESVVGHFLSAAPEALPEPQVPTIPPTLERFKVRPIHGFSYPSGIVHAAIDEKRHEFLVSDLVTRSLTVFDAAAVPLHRMTSTSPVASVRRDGDRLWATAMGPGAFYPTDLPSGEIIARPVGDGFIRDGASVKLAKLHRPVHTAFGDINGDGIEDLVVSEFGNQVGVLSWFEGRPDGSHARHVLHPFPGALGTALHDFNGDGKVDIAALFGQNWEGIYVFYNAGGGEFIRSYVIQHPPNWGNAAFLLRDFNGDGQIDILTVNGDNGDYAPVLKPYHGIRVYLNDGTGGFDEEAFFFPLPGAYGVAAEDFDLDGDLDIAAVAFFPDFARPEQGFVYLENRGDWTFVPSTIPEAGAGRWMVINAGDLDGDGDKDLIIGSHAPAFPDAPDSTRARWEKAAAPVLLLENTTRP